MRCLLDCTVVARCAMSVIYRSARQRFARSDRCHHRGRGVVVRCRFYERGVGRRRLSVFGYRGFGTAGQAGNDEEKIRLVAIEMCEFGVRYNVALVRALKADGCFTRSPTKRSLNPTRRSIRQWKNSTNDLASRTPGVR